MCVLKLSLSLFVLLFRAGGGGGVIWKEGEWKIATASWLPTVDRLAGLVVKASASGVEDPGFESRLRLEFSRSSHTSDLKIGTPVATLPGIPGPALGFVGPVSVYCDWVR